MKHFDFWFNLQIEHSCGQNGLHRTSLKLSYSHSNDSMRGFGKSSFDFGLSLFVCYPCNCKLTQLRIILFGLKVSPFIGPLLEFRAFREWKRNPWLKVLDMGNRNTNKCNTKLIRGRPGSSPLWDSLKQRYEMNNSLFWLPRVDFLSFWRVVWLRRFLISIF